MLTPLVGAIEALGAAEMPVTRVAERLVDLFVREVYETPAQRGDPPDTL